MYRSEQPDGILKWLDEPSDYSSSSGISPLLFVHHCKFMVLDLDENELPKDVPEQEGFH